MKRCSRLRALVTTTVEPVSSLHFLPRIIDIAPPGIGVVFKVRYDQYIARRLDVQIEDVPSNGIVSVHHIVKG